MDCVLQRQSLIVFCAVLPLAALPLAALPLAAEFPERAVSLSSGVTSAAFSTAHPNLLAVGLYDGARCACACGPVARAAGRGL